MHTMVCHGCTKKMRSVHGQTCCQCVREASYGCPTCNLAWCSRCHLGVGTWAWHRMVCAWCNLWRGWATLPSPDLTDTSAPMSRISAPRVMVSEPDVGARVECSQCARALESYYHTCCSCGQRFCKSCSMLEHVSRCKTGATHVSMSLHRRNGSGTYPPTSPRSASPSPRSASPSLGRLLSRTK